MLVSCLFEYCGEDLCFRFGIIITTSFYCDQLERLGVYTESVEYAEAPSTPGLVQEPNLFCVQEAPACDDHFESEDRNSNELVAAVSTVNTLSNPDLNYADCSAVDWSLQSNPNCDIVQYMFSQGSGHHVRDLEVKHVKPLGDSVNSMTMVSDYSEGTIGALDGSDRLENMKNAGVNKNVLNIMSVEQGIRSDETAASPSCSYVTSDAQEQNHRTYPDGTNEPVSEGCLMDGHPVEMPSNVLKPSSLYLSQPDMSSAGNGHDNAIATTLQSEDVEPFSSEISGRDEAHVEGRGL